MPSLECTCYCRRHFISILYIRHCCIYTNIKHKTYIILNYMFVDAPFFWLINGKRKYHACKESNKNCIMTRCWRSEITVLLEVLNSTIKKWQLTSYVFGMENQLFLLSSQPWRNKYSNMRYIITESYCEHHVGSYCKLAIKICWQCG
jgi:hypothetical protein